jgi:sugar lactone lactonase YvrE
MSISLSTVNSLWGGTSLASKSGLAFHPSGTLITLPISLLSFIGQSPNVLSMILNVTTFAGTAGAFGSADGTGSDARFTYPSAFAFDSTTGDIYVSDTDNHAIRKITSGGAVTTWAGLSGTSGSADGTRTAARFNRPGGLCRDSSGNLYVVDTGNHTIRKITSGGTVSTLAGLAGSSGSANGTGSVARFNSPLGITIDTNPNLYVTDTGNHTIRRITTAGDVVTYVGLAGSPGTADGFGNAARFNSPSGITVDSGFILYISDTNNHTIRKVDGGTSSTLSGLAGTSGSADGLGNVARFNRPAGITFFFDSIYVTDELNHTIRIVSKDGLVSTLAGLAGTSGSADGLGNVARFNRPVGIMLNSTLSELYVADGYNHTIRKIAFSSGGVVTTVAGLNFTSGSADGTGSAARFNFPEGICADSSANLYVADTVNHTIRKITSGGAVSTLAGLAGSSGSADGTGSAARFNRPSGIAVDNSGNLYVTDRSNRTIRKITSGGAVSTLAGLAGSSGSADGTGSAARFNFPEGICADSSGNLYVADTLNNTIRKITSGGAVSTLAGLAGSSGSADGTGSAARFNGPSGIAVDNSGNLYVTEFGEVIRKITSGGTVSTLAGVYLKSGSMNGIGSAARFYNPTGITIDVAGNLYVAEEDNSIIRKITPAGLVTTVAGFAGSYKPGVNGTGVAAGFNRPTGMTIDVAGNLYIADTFISTIRKIT